jgi:hypothetical protein
MRRPFKKWMIFLTMFFLFLLILGLESALAQQYSTYVGKVVSLSRGNINVKGNKGEIVYFRVGRRTVYIPRRLPGIGEWVKVSYLFRRGYNVAYQVEILPPPSPPKKK